MSDQFKRSAPMDEGPLKFRILPGLPGTGPEAVEFNWLEHRTYSEGFVVEFNCGEADEWVGNFLGQGGASYCSDVRAHPDQATILVIARGDAYRVNPRTRTCERLKSQITEIIRIPESGLALLVSLTDVICHDAGGCRWCTRRISFDGLRNLMVDGDALRGESWDPSDRWVPFSVSLKDGAVDGGSYPIEWT